MPASFISAVNTIMTKHKANKREARTQNSQKEAIKGTTVSSLECSHNIELSYPNRILTLTQKYDILQA